MSSRKSTMGGPEMSPPGTEPFFKGKTSKGAPRTRSQIAAKSYATMINVNMTEKKTKDFEESLKVADDPRLGEITRFAGYEDYQKQLARRICARRSEDPKFVISDALEGCHDLQAAASSSAGATSDVSHRRHAFDRLEEVGKTPCEAKTAFKENFDATIKRLLIDFDLSSEAKCRSEHLDRLHQWFKEQGTKQARRQEQRPAPNFLTLEPPRGGAAGRWPKGSPRNNDAPLSEQSILLSSTMRMKKSAALVAAARPLTAR